MLNKLRGFSNTKLAGLLIAIIIVPFVFWGMGSVFSGGNTNNIVKINDESISTQDFMKYINQTRMDVEYIKKNINNNVIENIISKIVSIKLLDMEINDLNISISDKALAEKIKNNEVFLDDKKNFSRIKYEKFLLENNLTAPVFEIRFKNEELKKNLFSYVGGGIKSPYFLNNKIYISKTKEVEIDYFNLDIVYDTETSETEINQFIKDNEENLKEELIDFSYAKITPSNLIEIDEFNNEFFKKIDDIENSILNGSNIEDIKKKYNLKLEYLNNYNNDDEENEILKEIYQKKNDDKIQLIDKNDYYLLYEISKIKKILPSKSDLNFIKRVKENLILKKKYEFNKDLIQKIQDKKLNEDEFLKISSGEQNILNTIIKSVNDDKVFNKESINLVYSLPINSFVLITDVNNEIYLAKINNIITKNLSKNDINNKEYLVKSNSKIIDEIYSSYDLSLNKKYKVKVFENTLDRIKNNFK
jgi:peptidyl-prolyl cis-trans isomerase D